MGPSTTSGFGSGDGGWGGSGWSFAAPANRGGGGSGASGPGGSGVVIIRYPDTYPDAASTTGSPTYSNTGGYKIYNFTGNGSITF